MLIDLATVGTGSRHIEETFAPAAIDFEDELVTVASSVDLHGQIRRRARGVELAGRFSAELRLTCSRCLKAVDHRLEQEFRAVFVGPDEDLTGIEVELNDDLLDESIAETGVIDTAEVVREQLLLAVPERVFCRDDCRGLCLRCGADLNLIDCKCGEDDIDPRWAALSKLK